MHVYIMHAADNYVCVCFCSITVHVLHVRISHLCVVGIQPYYIYYACRVDGEGIIL